MATRVLAAAGLLATLAAGCGSTVTPASETSTTGKTYVVKLEPATLPKDLPAEACFVGIRSYDVIILGEGLPEKYSCSRVADEVFPRAEQLPWSRDEYLKAAADAVDECELEREGGRLSVVRGDPDQEGPRFDGAYDLAERACARLEREGWKMIFQEQ